jgi:repressor LexA
MRWFVLKKPRGDNQAKILAFIKSEVQAKGYPPSVREICDAVGLRSTSTVHGHLMRLEKKGLLHRDSMKPRAMEVVDDEEEIETYQRNTTPIPIVGQVTAGIPILAEENIDEYLPMPNDLLGDGEHFILRVHGESMINAGILDRDYIIVHRQPDALNGEIVVALIEDEATVKRFYKERGHFRLQPENDTMDPILVSELTILGKVVSLIRKF